MLLLMVWKIPKTLNCLTIANKTSKNKIIPNICYKKPCILVDEINLKA